MQPRVVVCDPSTVRSDPMLSTLAEQGYDVRSCRSMTDLLESVTQRRPAAVIVTLTAIAPGELQMLRLLRRVAPGVPLVVVTEDGSIAAQRAVRALNPTYLALTPLDPDELLGAIRGALMRPRFGSA